MPPFPGIIGPSASEWVEVHHPRKDVEGSGLPRPRCVLICNFIRQTRSNGSLNPVRLFVHLGLIDTVSLVTTLRMFPCERTQPGQHVRPFRKRHRWATSGTNRSSSTPLSIRRKIAMGTKDYETLVHLFSKFTGPSLTHGADFHFSQLSDRFDRDRERLRSGTGDLVSGGGSPSSSTPRRDAAPHLAQGNRQSSSSAIPTINGRRDSRLSEKDRLGDRERDLPARPNGAEPRRHERSATLNGKDETRNEKSDDWRRGEC